MALRRPRLVSLPVVVVGEDTEKARLYCGGAACRSKGFARAPLVVTIFSMLEVICETAYVV